MPASAKLLKHVAALSRDYFYIDLSLAKEIYLENAIVGGEHENNYLLLGFAGDRFEVLIQSQDGHVGYVRKEDSYRIDAQNWDEKAQQMTIMVTVLAQHAWIDISFSTHPVAEYQLQLSKLTAKQ